MEADHQRRFGGVAKLYGPTAAQKLEAAHVCVIGIGGVGSWAVEALARSAVGRLTLIDLDMVAESNTNRQIHALGDVYGKAKVEAMADRVRAINPRCQLSLIEDFVTPENTGSLLGGGFDIVVDAIDQVRTKIAMVAWCLEHHQPIITVGAAGGQLDPTRVRIDDLARAEQDPLLSKLRSQLRRHHGLPRAPAKSGVTAVYSTEPLRYPTAACDTGTAPTGLNCAGYGSSVCVTASFGFAAASWAIGQITGVVS